MDADLVLIIAVLADTVYPGRSRTRMCQAGYQGPYLGDEAPLELRSAGGYPTMIGWHQIIDVSRL